VLKLKGKHFIDPKRSEILSVSKVFLVRRKVPFFDQNCCLPFSLRSLDIPVLLRSWQKHYNKLGYVQGVEKVPEGSWGTGSLMQFLALYILFPVLFAHGEDWEITHDTLLPFF
jgi:hypothetical protein